MNKKFDIGSFLKSVGIEIVSESDTEYRCRCPWHKPDIHPSLSVNKITGQYICFKGCSQGKFSSLVKLLSGQTLLSSEILKKIISSRILDKLEKQEKICKTIGVLKEMIYFEDDLIKASTKHKYWDYILNRLKFETIIHFKLGYCKEGQYQNRIIIPIQTKNGIEGFIARSIFDNLSSQRRYLYPSGIDISKLVFNLDFIETSYPVILCESCFDAMTTWELGFKQVVAVFGANLSLHQISKLVDAGIKKLVLCFHNDEAGNKAIEKRKSLLLEVFREVTKIELPQDQDINEIRKISNLYYRRKKL